MMMNCEGEVEESRLTAVLQYTGPSQRFEIMKNTHPLLPAAPFILTRRSFAAAAVLSILVPPTAALAQSRPPGFTFYGRDPGDSQGWADVLRLESERFAPGQFDGGMPTAISRTA